MPLIFFFLPLVAFAHNLEVKDGLKNYRFSSTSTKLELLNSDIHLRMVKKSCNQKIFSSFVSSLSETRKMLPSISRSSDLTVVWDKKDLMVARNSPAEKFLRILPLEFQRMKAEEHFRCKK